MGHFPCKRTGGGATGRWLQATNARLTVPAVLRDSDAGVAETRLQGLRVNEINPGQPLLWIDILGWREIFRMIQAASCDVDLVGAPVRLVG